MEARDRRLVEVAGERVVDRVVRGRGADLPAVVVEQPLAVGVVVDHVTEADAAEEADHRLGLRLGGGGRAAVGLARRDRRGALVVVAPVRRGSCGSGRRRRRRSLPVAVVVAEVLPPEPLGVEGVLVAVGVGHRHEPQLGGLEQLADAPVVGPPLGDVVGHQPAVTSVAIHSRACWVRAVEHRRTGPVLLPLGTLGQLDGQDLATLVGGADLDQLGDLRVGLGDRVHLVADAAGLVVRAPHGVAAGRLGGGELAQRLAALDPGQVELHARGPEPRGLLAVQDQVDLHLAACRLLRLADVEALGSQVGQLLRGHGRGVGVEWISALRCRR